MRVKVFTFLCSGSNHRSLVTSTMHRKGSAARAEVIDPTIKLKTLCTLFKMTSAPNLHYSCIALSFPVYKNVSFCTRGQRSQPSLDMQPNICEVYISRCPELNLYSYMFPFVMLRSPLQPLPWRC